MSDAQTTTDDNAPDSARSRGRVRRVAAVATTVLAGLLVLVALLAPNDLAVVTPAAFLRIPVEGLIGVGLVLVLPGRARRVVAAIGGALLGLLTIVKLLDMGFFSAFDRPFDPMLDWSLLGPAVELVKNSVGQTGAIAAVVGAALLAIALPVLMTLAALRLTRLVVKRRGGAARTAGVLGLAWVLCAVLGVQVVADAPVAATSTAGLAYDQVRRVRADLRDQREFDAATTVDPFRNVPGDDLLTALRGKDVIVAFVESYGRVAVEDPGMAPQVGAVLADGDRRLGAAGFSARSAFVTSPTAGGGSWLAHSTLQTGLWVNSQQRYDEVVASDRLTLSQAFKRAGWRTVGVVPANGRDWPEGAFYGYDQIYDARNVGYKGPGFSLSSIPDQYTMSAFQRNERAKPDRRPLFAEIDLLSSHAPWAPVPRLIDWNQVGDGSAFNAMAKEGDSPEWVWQNNSRVRNAYRQSIEYSLNTLVSYVENYGDDNLVLVVLGDHQPAPMVSGRRASRDAPISVIAHDPAVLDRISGWGWQDGLRPDPQAPAWRMNTFRDRFLSAFGSTPQGTPAHAQPPR